eukprot:TRINITY_DN26222_c0_g1_i1.p1 TRINITY_DN26222_c0_g1~~TRINITY_DN26222_c0_g1_i1.p1  ORF type:complete len:320 (-),score=95.53 TRINITY_DN26222_c0_g1_i1:48-1007(-)
MIRRPPRSTQSRSSAASDVYKRQVSTQSTGIDHRGMAKVWARLALVACLHAVMASSADGSPMSLSSEDGSEALLQLESPVHQPEGLQKEESQAAAGAVEMKAEQQVPASNEVEKAESVAQASDAEQESNVAKQAQMEAVQPSPMEEATAPEPAEQTSLDSVEATSSVPEAAASEEVLQTDIAAAKEKTKVENQLLKTEIQKQKLYDSKETQKFGKLHERATAISEGALTCDSVVDKLHKEAVRLRIIDGHHRAGTDPLVSKLGKSIRTLKKQSGADMEEQSRLTGQLEAAHKMIEALKERSEGLQGLSLIHISEPTRPY